MKNNELDEIKKTKFVEMSDSEKSKQKKYFAKWCIEMLDRKTKGNEKYGNYMLKVDKKTALNELKEEFLDCCNHIVFLMYRIENLEQIK